MSSISLHHRARVLSAADDTADPFLAPLGPVGRALHRAAMAEGPLGLVPRSPLLDRPFSLGTHAAAALLVVAAHTGHHAAARSLGRELRGVLPRGAGLYWLALSLQRAGRGAQAARVLHRAVGRRDLDPVVRPWLLTLRARAIEPAPETGLGPLRERVSARVRARAVLASLSLGPWAPGGGGVSIARCPATLATVALLLFVYILEQALGGATGEVLVGMGALVAPPRGLVDLPRLVAYLPLHATVWHLGMNTLALGVFGRFVEARRGWRSMAGVFVGAGVVAGVSAWSVGGPETLVVGASGAVLGLVGATVVTLLGARKLRATPEGRAGLIALGVLLVAQCGSDLAGARVSAAAHVGGLLAGAALMAWAEGWVGGLGARRTAE